MSNSKTFSANGKLDDSFDLSAKRELFVFLGKVDGDGNDIAVNLGGGTLLICIEAEDGSNFIVLKEITSLTDKDDKASRFILPPTAKAQCILKGATSPDLYVELLTGERLS